MADQKISDLTEATSVDGTEYVEMVQTGTNKKVPISLIAVTREFNRAWDAELLFDKNEIEYVSHTLTGDVEYTISPGGNLSNQFSCAVQTITTDGTHIVTFTDFQFIYGIQNGTTPDAGTYQIFFMYRNGITTAHFASPTFEESGLQTLSTPGNFTATADGQTEIDLTWDDVANDSGYRIDFGASSSGPWSLLFETAVGATSYSHTGLSPGSQVFYRIQAMGDGVTFADSGYATDNAITENSGDVTAPTFTFSPVDAATDIPINGEVVITASEPIRMVAGNTVLTNANVASVLTVKEDNISGADIPFTATINAGKTEITIVPDVIWGSFQAVFIQISGVEDVNDNAASTDDITFTTSDYTQTENNYLDFGTQLDSFLTGEDKVFKIEITVRNTLLSGLRTIAAKYQPSTNNSSFIYRTEGSNVTFRWYNNGAGDDFRLITWTGVMDDSEHTLRLEYDGTVDTNNGLDRADLYIDNVIQGSKSLQHSNVPWPFGIAVATANLIVGHTFAEVKDFSIEASAADQVNVLEIRTGEDTSGNNRDGVWTSF